jgi:carbon storage regulator
MTMLVLSRKVQEQIRLPGLDVVVTVLEVRGGMVRLGITAPDQVAVVREELW